MMKTPRLGPAEDITCSCNIGEIVIRVKNAIFWCHADLGWLGLRLGY